MKARPGLMFAVGALSAFVLVLALAVASFLASGCATAPDPRDPTVYRPAAPIAHPIPR